jgi:deoxyribodipyrimidine photo-lyase
MSESVLLWFRRDLRLADNPAVAAATATGKPVIPLYLWSPGDDGDWPPGAASRAWLSRSLSALDDDLRARGSRLLILKGDSPETIPRLAATCSASMVFANRRHEPSAAAVDTRVKTRLEEAGIAFRCFEASLLFDPEAIRTRSGGPFQVFTPFWRACLSAAPVPSTLPAPKTWATPSRWPSSLSPRELPLLPHHPWAERMLSHWSPGEAGARKRLRAFCTHALFDYSTARDRPAADGVSRLSPHLHFGELSPRQIWHAVRDRENAGPAGKGDAGAPAVFLRQLGWREFSHHVLHHFPRTDRQPLRPAFSAFPWSHSPAHLRAWQQGQTGYPLVDAGMRELWATGFMHNRVRMVVASFLVKDLLQPWLEGARWFWDTLVDADLAQNSLNWQWCAGCGADAAPYFRILNPTTQAERFDPQGEYIRRWVPELAALPSRLLFAPWNASRAQLGAAGVALGKTYPAPIVDHETARARALSALRSMRGPSSKRTSAEPTKV